MLAVTPASAATFNHWYDEYLRVFHALQRREEWTAAREMEVAVLNSASIPDARQLVAFYADYYLAPKLKLMQNGA